MSHPDIKGNKEKVKVIGVGTDQFIGQNEVIRLNPNGSGWGASFYVPANNLKEFEFEELSGNGREKEMEAMIKQLNDKIQSQSTKN